MRLGFTPKTSLYFSALDLRIDSILNDKNRIPLHITKAKVGNGLAHYCGIVKEITATHSSWNGELRKEIKGLW